MRSASRLAGLALFLAAGCNGGSSSSTSAANALRLSVDGSLCHEITDYPNKPCVEVTVCAPGTSECQVVDDVLLDTGSYGLRVFAQALGSVALEPVPAGSGALANCVGFVDQSSDWGPVRFADVVLGGEPPVRVPVHVLDATFGSPPASCTNIQSDPTTAGFNGILGVGVFAQDCGDFCVASIPLTPIYFSCSGAGCSPTTVPLADQVTNPVALLLQDNNGVVVVLPSVPAGGARSAEGTLFLGVGTRDNNALAGTTFPVDPAQGTLTTMLSGGVQTDSFVDTGSNGLFFDPPSGSGLLACSGSNSAWFCPASTVPLTATNIGYGNSPFGEVNFEVANFDSLAASGNFVFSDLGGGAVASGGLAPFDWGLPFFLGRPVAVGLEGRASSLGTGPFVAY